MKAGLLTLLLVAFGGCSSQQQNPTLPVSQTQSRTPVNPSFTITESDAENAIKAMREKPVALQRPLVIIGGYGANLSPSLFKLWFSKSFNSDDLILTVACGMETSFDGCREKVINAIEKKFPSNDPNFTVEVDVVGVSMGGVVARYAACPVGNSRRLKIHALYTISSPHTGAKLADKLGLTTLQKDLQTGSAFLRQLVERENPRHYSLFPYIRLEDEVVGAENAAPAGEIPYWISGPAYEPAHFGAMMDKRILGDICKRIRDETPFTQSPPAPLPVNSGSPRKF